MTDLDLLRKTQEVMRAEQKLTALLEKVESWLQSSSSSPGSNSNKLDHYRERVRPIPVTMEQVDVILAMARNWSSKTSAPAGWDPQLAPVMGFATPNPLPHQLRGGALAALQLERATTQKYRSQQRQQQQLEEEARESQRSKQEDNEEKQRLLEQQRNTNDADTLNPKKRKTQESDSRTVQQQQHRGNPQRLPSVDVTMNLSDSSSEEDDDGDEEEEEAED